MEKSSLGMGSAVGSRDSAEDPQSRRLSGPREQITTPPPYSGPSRSSQPVDASTSSKAFRRYPGLPRIDYKLYAPPLCQLSKDGTTLSTKAEYLSANAAALVSMLRTQSTVPPKPQIQVKGKRGPRVDFDLKLNLMSLLIPEDEEQRIDYIRCVGEGETAFRGGIRPATQPDIGDLGLEEWCRRYVKDSSALKTFTLERVVANLDVSWIEGQLRSLVASLNYRGVVDVQFTLKHSRVVIQNPDKVNQFFTSVASLFAGTNKYEVVQAVWPFATSQSGEPSRQYVVMSEEAWWKEWKDPIRYALVQKRQGWVTMEDKLETLMDGKGGQIGTVEWDYSENY